MTRDLYGMSERLADLGAGGRERVAARRASFVTWMTPSTTPVVVGLAAVALLLPELAAAVDTMGKVAFGAGAILLWAAVTSAVFWLLLDTLRDRILTGCLFAGALIATTAALVPPEVDGLALPATIAGVIATVASIVAVGVVSHESRLRRRGRLVFGGTLVAAASATHVTLLQATTSAPVGAGLAVTLLAVHAIGVTALLSALEDRLPTSPVLGTLVIALLVAGAAAGLRTEPGNTERAPFIDAAARTAERVASGIVHDVPALVDDITEDAGDDTASADAHGDEHVVSANGASHPEWTASASSESEATEPALRAALGRDDERAFTAAHELMRRGAADDDQTVREVVLQSLCDPRPEHLAAAVDALAGDTSPVVVRRLRAWLACRRTLDDRAARALLDRARAITGDGGTRLALDVAARAPDRRIEDAGVAIAARRLPREDALRAAAGARAMAAAAREIEAGGADGVTEKIAVARSSPLAAGDDVLALLELQYAALGGDHEAASRLARDIVESNAASPWRRRRARATHRTLRAAAEDTSADVEGVGLPQTPGSFFARRVVVTRTGSAFAPGIGPGAWRIGWRFGAGVPAAWTFLPASLEPGVDHPVRVPGTTPGSPGEHVAELVMWRPRHPPVVLASRAVVVGER